jgi:hypothetical protein
VCFCILSLSIILDHLTFLVDCDHQSLMSATMSLERVAPRMSCLRSAGCSSRTGAKKDMHLSPRPETISPLPGGRDVGQRGARCGRLGGEQEAVWNGRALASQGGQCNRGLFARDGRCSRGCPTEGCQETRLRAGRRHPGWPPFFLDNFGHACRCNFGIFWSVPW